jgi:hypothetical protein
VPFRHYPPEDVSLMSRVLDDCVATVVGGQDLDAVTLDGINMRCAQLILGAVAQGERNPEALKWIVLKKIAQPHLVDTVMLAFMPG